LTNTEIIGVIPHLIKIMCLYIGQIWS